MLAEGLALALLLVLLSPEHPSITLVLNSPGYSSCLIPVSPFKNPLFSLLLRW